MYSENDITELEDRIGYHFKDRALIRMALTHSSYANEQKINKQPDYERLEFLGDSVLEMVSSTYLYNNYPDKKEGQMTKMRASMVCEQALAFCARDFELEKYILLGKGEESTGGRHRDSIISDVMEAVIGAIYIDGGIDYAKKHIDKFILNDLENKQIFVDAKSVLQELVQKDSTKTLSYEICGESGPEHDKIFKSRVLINGEILGEGEGHTKKAAEQQAAYQAVLKIKDKA
ncbi:MULTISPECIES: ribonuclease III [Butyrivibrio]|uniref:Ribonuclease 3 n=1 Tax=Butyrivibrio fibrisolvens TaxID=831 RepID=A0A1H9LUS2_BUTFI|nr:MULTISPECIES: ribonuclease III [Butyrivibrio]MCR4636281.1 ribonuclease III [Butyrivibrio sp.]PWT28509.1 ribonuclease III [Butyrivibrio fibrisolvens]SEP54989.1 ribonuclease-3 [Butyrivibrio sp. TB]SER15186.1 ribonuclease-3 [Butyrivibrio fibrisolvens]